MFSSCYHSWQNMGNIQLCMLNQCRCIIALALVINKDCSVQSSNISTNIVLPIVQDFEVGIIGVLTF